MTEREKFERWFNDEIGFTKESINATQEQFDGFKNVAEAIWQAATKAAVPEGWQLVQVEPTEDMIKKAQIEFFRNHPYENFDDWTVAGYKTMLAAVPEVKDER